MRAAMPVMIDTRQALEFEKPIVEPDHKTEELKALAHGALQAEIPQLERKPRRLQERVFATLTPLQKVQLSRHQQRPFPLDYIHRLIDDFFELHGDRAHGED